MLNQCIQRNETRDLHQYLQEGLAKASAVRSVFDREALLGVVWVVCSEMQMVEASVEWAKCWIQDEACKIQDMSEKIFVLRKKTHSDELTGWVGGGSADWMAFKRVTMLRIMWVFRSEMKMLQVLAEGLQGRDEVR